MKLVFKLVKLARKSGGDKYEAIVSGEARSMVIYFPQSISRKNGDPRETITVTID